MTSRKGSTGQAREIFESCVRINQILRDLSVEGSGCSGFSRRRDTGRIDISWEFSPPARIGGEFYHDKKRTNFEAAYGGLNGVEREQLRDMSTRALAVAEAARQNKIGFIIGETQYVEADSPFVGWYRGDDDWKSYAGHIARFNVTGVNHQDLVLFTPTCDSVIGANKGTGRLYLDFWGDGLDLETGYSCAVPANTHIQALEDNFSLMASSSQKAEQKISYFKKWLRGRAIPQGMPVVVEIGNLLGKGYGVTEKNYESERERKDAIVKRAQFKGLGGKVI